MASLLAILQDRRKTLKAEEGALVAAAESAADPMAALASSADRRAEIAADLAKIDGELAAETARRDRERADPEAAAPAPVVIRSGIEPVRASASDKAPTPFRHFGEQLSAIREAAIGAKSGYAPSPKLAAVMDYAAAASGLNETVGSEGGFAVQTDFAEGMFGGIETQSVLWPKSFAIPLSADSNGVKVNLIDETTRVTGSRWGGVQVYWAAEAASVTAKKPKLFQLELTLQKLFGVGYRTDEIGQDWQASGAIMDRAFTAEMAFALDDAAVRGSGAGIPLGFLNSSALVTVTAETGQTADTVVTENVEKMFARMPARSKGKACWYINGDVWPQIFGLQRAVGTGGQPMFIATGALGEAPGGTLLGRPVIEIEQASALGDVGDISFVDMGEYLRLEKGGIARASSIHVEFLTDQEVFRWILRTNGAPGWKSAVTRYKGASTVSPFIALGAR
jgi:HK97 family phage major capsid protein